MAKQPLKNKNKMSLAAKRGAKKTTLRYSKPNTKNKSKNQTSNRNVAEHVRHVLDPCTMAIPPSMTFQANCYPINQTVRHDFDQTAGNDRMYFVSAYGGSGTVGVGLEWDASLVATTVTRFTNTLPLLSASNSAGGASSSKCSKVGIRIVNSTANLYVAGRVYVARIDQRLAFPALLSAMTPTQLADLKTVIKALPETMLQSYAASEFTPGGKLYGKSIPCHIVDDIDYNNYEAHGGSDTVDGFGSHIGLTTVQAPGTRPMSTIVVIFEKAAVLGTTFNQNYTINLDAQYLTR